MRYYCAMSKSQQRKRVRVGILGGTFDPVHIGHLLLAQSALETWKLDKVIFMPNNVSPLKLEKRQSSFRHRLAMLKLALRGQSQFEVSDIEFRRGGVSYTFDTVTALKKTHPDWDIYFIIGMDSLRELHLWYRAKELIKICRVVTLARPYSELGIRNEELGIKSRVAGFSQKDSKQLIKDIATSRQIDISSSEIRSRIAKQQEIRYLVPERVEKYIHKQRLYL